MAKDESLGSRPPASTPLVMELHEFLESKLGVKDYEAAINSLRAKHLNRFLHALGLAGWPIQCHQSQSPYPSTAL